MNSAFERAAYGTATHRLGLWNERPASFALPIWMIKDWAIITAHNPRSVCTEPSRNNAAQEKLRARLQEMQLDFLEGFNDDGKGGWHEPTFIVRGISATEAVRLGRAFGQSAVLTGHPDRP